MLRAAAASTPAHATSARSAISDGSWSAGVAPAVQVRREYVSGTPVPLEIELDSPA
jgi:hypothetical protein